MTDMLEDGEYRDDDFEDLEEFARFAASLDNEERHTLDELLSSLATELVEQMTPPEDLLFVGSDGKRVVKGLHYPREVLGEDGPVILPSASQFVILGAFSDEFIRSDADEIAGRFDSDDEREDAWQSLMANYAYSISKKFDDNPPEDYSRLFEE
jgi:hypothetical protein